MKIDGQCHCGSITYEADVDPDEIYVCHCTDCQAVSGTAFRWAVPVPEGTSSSLLANPRPTPRWLKAARRATNYSVPNAHHRSIPSTFLGVAAISRKYAPMNMITPIEYRM